MCLLMCLSILVIQLHTSLISLFLTCRGWTWWTPRPLSDVFSDDKTQRGLWVGTEWHPSGGYLRHPCFWGRLRWGEALIQVNLLPSSLSSFPSPISLPFLLPALRNSATSTYQMPCQILMIQTAKHSRIIAAPWRTAQAPGTCTHYWHVFFF